MAFSARERDGSFDRDSRIRKRERCPCTLLCCERVVPAGGGGWVPEVSGRGRGAHDIWGAGGQAPRYKARGTRLGERSLPVSARRHLPRLPPLLDCSFAAYRQPLLLCSGEGKRAAGGAHGVQLRGHGGGGGQVPRPPPQHHAHRRGHGVAQDDGEELVVRLLRPRPRRRGQVRLRSGHARRVLQVPPPPHHQLPRPRPPGVPSLPGRRHHLRRAAASRATVVLPHRRGAVTAPHLPQPRTAHPRQQRGERRREQGKRTFSCLCLVTQGRELICSSLHLDAIGKQKENRVSFRFFFARLFVGVESPSNRLPSLHQKKSPCLY